MKVYLISGKAKHGKDTLGQMIKEVYIQDNKKACITQYSKYIKYYAKEYFGWNGSEEDKPRELLQRLGSEIIRQKLNKPLFHINRLCEDIEILSYFYDVIIVTDVRFPDEIKIPIDKFENVISIHIERPNFINTLSPDENKHITEHALDEYNDYDYKIINTTLEQLKKDALNIVRKEEVKNEKND